MYAQIIRQAMGIIRAVSRMTCASRIPSVITATRSAYRIAVDIIWPFAQIHPMQIRLLVPDNAVSGVNMLQ
jgi:hypothetical protein